MHIFFFYIFNLRLSFYLKTICLFEKKKDEKRKKKLISHKKSRGSERERKSISNGIFANEFFFSLFKTKLTSLFFFCLISFVRLVKEIKRFFFFLDSNSLICTTQRFLMERYIFHNVSYNYQETICLVCDTRMTLIGKTERSWMNLTPTVSWLID